MFKHGIAYSEKPTSLVSMLEVAAPTVVIGTCPIHLATNPAPVNEPVLCNSFAEYVEQFGYSGDFDSFTCDEAAYCHFGLYNVKPLIVINVLDPSTHTKSGTKTLSITGTTAKATGVKAILSTLTAKSGETTLTKNTDYTVAYDDGTLVFTVKKASKISGNSVTLTYTEVDASKVAKADIIGGVDSTTLKNKGLECIADVFPKFGVVPGVLIAPKYSCDVEVATLMKSKVTDINGCFNCIALADIETGTVKKYTDANDYKNSNSLLDENLFLTWPKATLSGVQYHLSSHLAALMHQVDSDYDDVPAASPSNHALQIDGLCLKDGTSVYLDKVAANYLNSVGVMTGLNFVGWRAWGNYTSIYPSTTDPKDIFIPLRRMIQFLGNNIILTFFRYVDRPITRVLIEAIETGCQQYLNGLAASGYILGGEIRFDEGSNPITELIQGNIKFDLSIGFAVPAQSIEFSIEFDPSLYETLFS